MSKLLIHQEKSIISRSWKPKRTCTSDNEYIESFSRKEKIWKREKEKKLKNKKKDKRKKEKKRYTQKFIKKGVQYTLPNEKENRYMIQKKNHGRWPCWLQHVVDDPCLKIKPKKIFF